MTFDPLSGQGTAKALESAYRAVRCVLNGDDYQAACDELWNTFLEERSSFYRAESRWPNHGFWSRRHAAVVRSGPESTDDYNSADGAANGNGAGFQ
jgi:hypothetical protein